MLLGCRDLSEGGVVQVGNARGSFTAVLVVDDSVRPGVVESTKGWWRHGLNKTVLEKATDMGQGARFHDNGVTVTGVGRAPMGDGSAPES